MLIYHLMNFFMSRFANEKRNIEEDIRIEIRWQELALKSHARFVQHVQKWWRLMRSVSKPYMLKLDDLLTEFCFYVHNKEVIGARKE